MQRWILLRGLTREVAHWQGFDAALGRALPDVQVEAHDLPGAGTERRQASPMSIPGIADDVRRRVAATHGDPVVLVAVSLGAMVAVDWLVRAPGEVRAVVLMSSSLGRFSSVYRRVRPSAIPAMIRYAVARDPAAREAAVLGLTSNARAHEAPLLREWVAVQRERPVSKATALRQLVAAARYRGPRSLPQRPLLLLAGGADHLVHPSCTTTLALAYRAEVRVHASAGHDLTLDDPAWVVEQITSWSKALA